MCFFRRKKQPKQPPMSRPDNIFGEVTTKLSPEAEQERMNDIRKNLKSRKRRGICN